MDPLVADASHALASHLEDLRRWCLRRCRDPHEAADVAQEVAVQALQHWDAIKDPERLRAWIFRVGQRRMVDAARRRWPLVALTDEPAAPEPPELVAEGVVLTPEAKRLATGVRRAVRRLPPKLRHAVRLHYLRGFTIPDVASHLRTSVNTVKTRLYRARNLLREEPLL